MTTTIVTYPIHPLSKKVKKSLTYSDPRDPQKLKGRTIRVKGPYGSKSAQVTFSGAETTMRVTTSLFRAISGQNALTLPGLKTAVLKTFDHLAKRVHDEFGYTPRLDESRAITLGSVDIVRHYRVGLAGDVNALLSTLQRETSRRPGELVVGSFFRGGVCESVTIEIPKLQLKVQFYDKYRELQRPGHRLPQALPGRDELLNTTRGCVRVEITLGLAALKKRDLVGLSGWKKEVRTSIFDDVFAVLSLRGRFRAQIPDKLFTNLTRGAQVTYFRWKSGEIADEMLADVGKSTLARHKAELKQKLGIDLAQPATVATSEFVRLKDVFTSERLVRPTEEQIKQWVPKWGAAIVNSAGRGVPKLRIPEIT